VLDKLRMTYHPAKKEVEFKRLSNEKELIIRKDSVLSEYMQKKGKFVLQDFGNQFFKDIFQAFDGQTVIDIEVVTTSTDFEDFSQMVEYFNESSSQKVRAKLVKRLPSMEDTYQQIVVHGKDAMQSLRKHKDEFWEFYKNSSVKELVEIFAKDIEDEIKNISEKIEKTRQSTVNLCFTGVYSSGKSSLINAILGYSIFPESIKSETAKMFKIISPTNKEKVEINFKLREHKVKMFWNGNSSTFEIDTTLYECPSRTSIQKEVNDLKGKEKHIQVGEILKHLNTNEDVTSEIEVVFPIPLDNERIKFTIYDTPGTDSNFEVHQATLQEALSNQTHSILIFVAAPDKIEGAGNNALLQYLKSAEQNDTKTSIDIGRSLFVINKADTLTDPDQRRALRSSSIKLEQDEDFSIKLSDKKLFFTAAKIGYAGKAVENKVATENDEWELETRLIPIQNEKRGCYYKYNSFASSEYATNNMIKKSDDALQLAKEKHADTEILNICSGLYALETEIKEFGEKYSSSVKAFAIIDSVEKALSKLNHNAVSLQSKNRSDIKEVEA